MKTQKYEHEKGTLYMVAIVQFDTSTATPSILLGQTEHTVTITNNTEEVATIKQPGLSTDGLAYQDNSDGNRSVSLSVSISKLTDATADAARVAVFNKIKHSHDTTTLVYIGTFTEPDDETTSTAISTMKFVGERWLLKIASAELASPSDESITGTISFVGAGEEPKDVTGVLSTLIAADAYAVQILGSDD
ncbi:MAG: hypothetical protein R3Y39_08960 [Rikenellaceae bacterium]